jgi:hypothetical protein
MNARSTPDDDDRDWRLAGELQQDGHGLLHGFVERMRDPAVLEEVRAAVPEDVVITHDGSRLFAYAAGRRTIEDARAAIEVVLVRDGLHAELALSHFSTDLDEWVDPDVPPPAGAPSQASGPSRGEVRSRTLVASAGKMIREDFEQSMRAWADQLGLRCEIVEHPHLLSTQVAFTVTGPPRKLDEFAAALAAEERQTIRTEREVMLSPL